MDSCTTGGPNIGLEKDARKARVFSAEALINDGFGQFRVIHAPSRECLELAVGRL